MGSKQGCGTKCRRRLGRCSLLLILPFGFLPALRAANSLDLEIASKVDGDWSESAAISIDIGTSEEGTQAFWLRHTGDEALVGVALQTDLTADATVQMSGVEQEEDGSFTIGHRVRVIVSVSEVGAPGRFKGVIIAKHGSTVVTLGTLEVVRSGSLTVRGPGVTADQIAASTDRARISRSYSIVSDDAVPRPATLEIDAFTGPNGPVETIVHVDGKKVEGTPGTPASSATAVKIPARGGVALTIAVDLPVEGEYSSALRLNLPGGRSAFSRTLLVTRTEADEPAFTIGPLANKEVPDLGWWGGETTAILNVSVTEKNRAPLDIDEVRLMWLHLVDGENKSEAERGTIQVYLDDDPVDGSFRVERNKTVTPQIRIPGLTKVGQYSGSLRMSAGNLDPVDVSLTLFVKRSWVLAFLAIAAGVVTAAVLRWFGSRRTQYAAQLKLAEVRVWLDQIQAPHAGLKPELADRLGAVVGGIQRRIARLEAVALRNPGADLETDLNEVRDKVEGPLGEWIVRLRRADEQGLLDEVQADLLAVEKFLGTWGSNATEFAEAQTRLEAIDAALAGRDVAALKAGILAQIELVTSQRDLLPAAKGGEVDSVVQQFLRARDLATTDAAASRAEFDQAWRDWTGLLVEEVIRDLPPPTNRPLGFKSDAVWQNVVKTAEDGFAAARAMAEPGESRVKFRETLRELVEAQLMAFSAGLGDAEAVAKKVKTATAKGRKAFMSAVRALAKKAQDIRGQLGADHLHAARLAYNQALDEWESALGKFQSAGAGSSMGKLPSPAAVSVLRVGAPPSSVAESAPEPAGWRAPLEATEAVAKLRSSQRLADFVWTTLAVAVIGLSGLLTLYLDAPAWGGLKDFVIAILWGLGLHTGTAAVTTAAVNRFSSLPGA